jgi:hypothetical protein
LGKIKSFSSLSLIDALLGPYDSAQVDRKSLSLGKFLARREKNNEIKSKMPLFNRFRLFYLKSV